jgi:hypothetical protein
VAATPAPALPTYPQYAQDAVITISAESFGACAFSFYGSTFTQLYLTDNGRLTFGGPDGSYIATVGGATSFPGTLGIWCDLSVVSVGTITVTSPATAVLSAAFVGVPYYNTGNLNTFSLIVDANSGALTINGIAGIQTNSWSSTFNQFIGISKGYGATNPGQTLFSNFVGLGLQPGPGGSGMTYRFGQQGTLCPGVSSITFVPNGSNYDFIVN